MKFLIAGVCALVVIAVAASQFSRTHGPRVFVSNEEAGTVSVIDRTSNTVIQTVSVGMRPRGIHLSPDGKRLHVALSGSPPAGPGVEEKELPPADKSADGIAVLDTQTYKLVKKLPSGSDPEEFAISADGSKLYLSNEMPTQ